MIELKGLDSSEAKLQMQKFGSNMLPEEKQDRFIDFLRKLCAPVPWLLEVIIWLLSKIL